MTEMITITSHDGFVFSAYEAKPPMHIPATPKERIIILQEIVRDKRPYPRGL